MVCGKFHGELIPIPVIRKLMLGGSEKARLVPARVDGALAKWRRHYGEPKGLSGKSSVPSVTWLRIGFIPFRLKSNIHHVKFQTNRHRSLII